MGVEDDYLQSRAPLPADVIGAPLTYDFVGTVTNSLRWRPRTRRLVVVTGASPWDRKWEATLAGDGLSN